MWRARVSVTLLPSAPALALDQLQHMEADPGFDQGAADLPGAERLGRLREHIRQLVGRAQADLTAALAVGVLAEFARHGGEVLATEHALERGLGLGAAAGALLGAGVLGHRDQDLRQIDRRGGGGGGAAFLEQLVDLAIGDADAPDHLVVAHALDQHLVAQVLAEALHVGAVLLQALDQLRHRELVLRGDVGHRAVQFRLLDAGAGIARMGDQHPLLDQGLLRFLARRLAVQGLAAACRLQLGALQATGDLAGRHHLGVDDHRDVVTGQTAGTGGGFLGHGGGGRRAAARIERGLGVGRLGQYGGGAAEQAERQGQRAQKGNGHGSEGRPLSLARGR